MPELLLNIAINLPLSRQFDYLPPAGVPLPAIGARVRVPFGRRQVVGLVMGHAEESELKRSRLKRAIASLDDTPLLGDDDLWLIRFTSDYYHHPIGEVAAAAMPTLLRKGDGLHPLTEFVLVTDDGARTDLEALAKRAPKQSELLTLLLDAGGEGIDTHSLTELLPHWRRASRGLFDKGLIGRHERSADEAGDTTTVSATPGPTLNERQQAAVESIGKAQGFAAFVLDGVTGSGKTEVYLHLIRECLKNGRQALVLVPEIGLTPQTVSRFRERLGVEPALLHSGLSDPQRLSAWRRARSGDAQLIVGTRSAIFTPLPRLGLVVVDEEHDHSFKQQEGLRYSARDLAVVRAKHADVSVIMGSATPSLELLQHCRDGSYTRLVLPERAGAARPPKISLIDISRAPCEDGLSAPLANAIEHHLDAGGQALLFLNRRGFAPTLICGSCGHVAECERCDSRMTVHAREQQLRCHHCGASRPFDDACAECESPVRPLGAGTERLEEALQSRFPDKLITRIDSDSTQRKGAMDAALSAATAGEADILVGTQMLSKGHHFPKLTLVGVVNADQGLFGTDFRSDERMAQSIVQVAGRSGREQQQGEVLIQTAFVQHPFWPRLIAGGYEGVSADALDERRAAHWPPFSRLALIRAAAHKRGDALRFLDATRRTIDGFGTDGVRVLGPVEAVMARRAGRYRAQLLLQSTDRRALHTVLRQLRPLLEADPATRKVRWSIDVDPIELM